MSEMYERFTAKFPLEYDAYPAALRGTRLNTPILPNSPSSGFPSRHGSKTVPSG